MDINHVQLKAKSDAVLYCDLLLCGGSECDDF